MAGPPLLPSELNASARGPCLDLSKDRLSVTYGMDPRHKNEVGAIQANRPVPLRQLVYYFEAKIVDRGELGRIAIGFTPAGFKLTRQPGWEPGSYGYHGDDGRKYCNSGRGEEYAAQFGTGDVVGAAYHLGKQEIFFTRNGVRLKTAFKGVKGELYPTMGLHSKSERVELNFGAQPFRFDIESMIAEERDQQQAAISSISVSSGQCHAIVRQYLLHHGFGDTLAAFDGAAGRDMPAAGSDSSPGSSGPGWLEQHTLSVRTALRQSIMRGDVQHAMSLLNAHYPLLLQPNGGYDHVKFHLSCQHYIELVRQGNVGEAITFAQTVLSSLPKVPELSETITSVVALIAYEDPRKSPLQHLLTPAHREQVADVVNLAVLGAAGLAASQDDTGAAVRETPDKSPLETLLQQLVAVHGALFEENGLQGEPYQLQLGVSACTAKDRESLALLAGCSTPSAVEPQGFDPMDVQGPSPAPLLDSPEQRMHQRAAAYRAGRYRGVQLQ